MHLNFSELNFYWFKSQPKKEMMFSLWWIYWVLILQINNITPSEITLYIVMNYCTKFSVLIRCDMILAKFWHKEPDYGA